MSSVAESFAHRRVRLGNVEPAAVALLKQLDPVIVILSLFLCEFAHHDRVTPALGAYSALAFVIAGQLFSRVAIREVGQSFSDFSHTYGRILLQWASVIAILLLAAFAFKVSGDLSRKVVLSWFGLTPVALCISHALSLRLHWFATNGARAPRHIIIGVNEVGIELARRLPTKGFMGYFDFRSTDRLAGVLQPEQLTGHCKDVADFV